MTTIHECSSNTYRAICAKLNLSSFQTRSSSGELQDHSLICLSQSVIFLPTPSIHPITKSPRSKITVHFPPYPLSFIILAKRQCLIITHLALEMVSSPLFSSALWSHWSQRDLWKMQNFPSPFSNPVLAPQHPENKSQALCNNLQDPARAVCILYFQHPFS